METRANYILIGAFTLIGLLASFGFTLWLAKIDVDRQYAYYDVLFDNVSGLSTAGDVRYNGLPVGQVVQLRLDPDDPSKVRVRLEIDAKTPVRVDTIATLQSMGVTGVSFVALEGGSQDAAPLERDGEIQSRRSGLQSLLEGAPELLEKAIALLEDVQSVVNEQNRTAVSDTLENIASASGRLDRTLEDFETLSADLGGAAQAIAGFTERLETLSDTAEVTLSEATETLVSVRESVDSAGTAFETADGLMQNELKDFIARGVEAAQSLETIVTTLEPSAVATLQAARGVIEDQLPTLVAQLQETAEVLETQVATVGTDASELMARYEEVGQAVQARVQQTETAIAAFEAATVEATATLESVRETSDTAGTVLAEDIKPLANEAAEVMATARGLTEEELPGLMAQAQTTLETVDREARALSADTRDMINAAKDRLVEARATLASIDGTLTETGAMMESMTATSNDIGNIVRGEGAALVADARAVAADAGAALNTINEAVQNDLPGVIENVSTAAETANRVIDIVGVEVEKAGPILDAFSQEGEAALVAATEAFSNANETLAAITEAMDIADGTLGAAEQTFASVNTILDEDIDVMITDIRGAVQAFTTTATSVSQDFDQVADEVLEASQSASNLLGTVDGIVQDNRRQVSEFMRAGLPQFMRFIEESRVLVVNLDRLADRVQRDPARFLLGTQSSEFSR